MEDSSLLLAFSNIYVAIFALFCFKLLIKVSLALLTHFYIVRGNRKEAARIAEEIYGISQGIQCVLVSAYFACVNTAMINVVTVDGITPLYSACSSGSVACVSMLLDHGANPELEIQLACPLHEAVIRGHRECAEMLITYGADIEKELQNRGTPLYLACAHQKTECVRRLLELGADVNHGKQRDSPLHAAARRTSVEIVKLLIDYGANIKYKNMEGKYPIEISVPKSPVERALLVAEGPASLAQLCRLSIRKRLGSSCLQVVPRLQLPNRLIHFLLYR
ncbi:hypothetical protein GDO78_008923 [Eleutherodactylus coqui]|uniref:Ankyrin repeat and SOCS box protein 11 n=1 Tax=Eleutherodactylus coqui TaxID=57060 RepID=A0A8J6FDK9_ELECQ|nr:hypothetical protein GDO78_008923 [Eleutherodactylus coqui]